MKFIELKLQGLLLAKSPCRTSFCICTFVLFFSECPPNCVRFRPHEVWFCPAYAFLSAVANANANLGWFLEDCASGTPNSFLPQGFDQPPSACNVLSTDLSRVGSLWIRSYLPCHHLQEAFPKYAAQRALVSPSHHSLLCS